MYTLPNFLNAPIHTPDTSARDQFFSNLLKSFHAPGQLQRTKQLEMEKIQKEQMNNALLKEFGRPREQAEVDYLQNRAIAEGLSPQEIMSRVALHHAQAEHYRNPLTTAQRELGEIYGRGTPEYKRAMEQERGIYGFEGGEAIPETFPEGTIGPSLKSMPANERLFVAKQMQNDLGIARTQMQTLPYIHDAKAIIKEHPNLWKSFSLMLDAKSKDDVGTITSHLAKQAINEKEKTAIDKMGKIASQLILRSDEMLGGGARGTDARRAIIAQGKVDIGNTPESNMYVLDKLESEAKGGPAWHNALKWGMKTGHRIIRDDEAFKTYVPKSSEEKMKEYTNYEPAEAEKAIKQATPKNKEAISQADLEATARKYNTTVEKVKERLGIE